MNFTICIVRFQQKKNPYFWTFSTTSGLHEKWMTLEKVRVPGWWTHCRWVRTERFIQLFMHSLKHSGCMRAVKWKVITALILIFIQTHSAVQVKLTHTRLGTQHRLFIHKLQMSLNFFYGIFPSQCLAWLALLTPLSLRTLCLLCVFIVFNTWICG